MTAPPSDPEMMQRFLAEQDTPCPGCGYNLRGLAAPRCPECNQALRLGVMLEDDGTLAIAAATAGLTAAGAGAAFFLVGVAAFSLRWGRWPQSDDFFYLVVAPGIIVLMDALMVRRFIQRRRWFLGLAPASRARATVACWGVSLAIFAIWLGFMVANVR